MKVVIGDVEEPVLKATCEELGDAVSGVTDVFNPASSRPPDYTFEKHGACHILFNNAGVSAPTSTSGRPSPRTSPGSTASTSRGSPTGSRPCLAIESGKRATCSIRLPATVDFAAQQVLRLEQGCGFDETGASRRSSSAAGPAPGSDLLSSVGCSTRV